MNDDVLTRNDDGELSVRTVSATETSTVVNPNDVYTRDTDGKLCIRTVGGSGGGSGGVSSVNGKTGAVVLTAQDVSAVPQYETMPTASASNLGNIVQYIGESGETYTSGYFYENKPIYSDSSATISQTAGTTDSISFETTAGNTTISGTTNAIRTLKTYSGVNLSAGTITFTYNSGTSHWDIVFNETHQSTDMEQSRLEGFGFEFTGTPEDGDTVVCTYTLGNIYNLSVDVETFETAEQPTGDETVSFVANVSDDLAVTTGTVDNLTVEISNVQLFLQKAKEFVVSQGDNTDIAEISVEVFQESEEHDILFDVDIETASANNHSKILGNDPTQWGIVYSGTMSNYNSWYFAIHHSQVQSTLTWLKGENVVNITTYGVSYTGNPTTGDTLTVVYTAPAITGYTWEQINVQPAAEPVGINWVASVDIPANSGLGWTCLPIYELEKPLADGEYEFYWQKTNISPNYSSNSPLLVSTYKARFRIYNNGNSIMGQLSPVIDGEYFADNANVWRSWQSYSSFKVNTSTGKWYLWMEESAFWGSNVPAYDSSRAVENAFKLSTIKNVNTGEEIGSTGTLSPSYPNVDYYVNGVLFATSLAPEPYIPTYFRKGTINFADMTSQYIMVFNYTGISTPEKNANCSELDIALSSSNGGKYHITIENGTDNYIANLIEASGDLADVQVGYDTNNNRVIVYLNMQSLPQSGYITLCIGTKGSSYAPDSKPISAPSNFTALSPTMVGSTIMPNVVGRILQYTGTTTASYTNGYFYKANGTIITVPQSTTAYNISPDTVSISIDADDLIQAIMNYNGWTESYTISMLKETYQWNIKLDGNGDIESVYWGGWGNFVSDSGVPACFTITNATAGSTTEFYVNYTPESQSVQNPSWDLVSVQPTYTAPSTMPTLAVADWNNSTQTVNVTGVTATNAVIISPAPASATEYASCGVLCTAQGSGTLTFTCQSTPTNDLTVNVIIL